MHTVDPMPPTLESPLDWQTGQRRYFSLNHYLRQRFGQRVQKVSIDAGFTCPNVDGTVTTGGCTFCDNRSFSPSRRIPQRDITDQIDEGIRRLKRRYKCQQFIAYFQPATNTYAAVDKLRELYDLALAHPEVVGLAIGTRPDCVADDVLDLLVSYHARTYLSVEYGMQTMHDASLDWMNRGHHHQLTREAVQRSHARDLKVCLHVILGLPGETHEMMMQTAHEVAALDVAAVKIHNLYAVRNTPLADQLAASEVTLMERDAYIETVVDFLEWIPPSMVIERISGEAPGDFLVAPEWCRDKPGVLSEIDSRMKQRDTWQGREWSRAEANQVSHEKPGSNESK
jgi:radical SAM protein (TIGR01212 family)